MESAKYQPVKERISNLSFITPYEFYILRTEELVVRKLHPLDSPALNFVFFKLD